MAEVWKYFSKIENEPKAKCLKCPNKIISCKGSSTSGLARHLAAIHKIRVNESDANAEGESSSKKVKTVHQPSVLQFAKRESLSEIVARLAAVDGFSIHGICKSQFIRQSLNRRQYILPKDKFNVMKLIHSYYEESAKLKTIEEIKALQIKGSKFSLTLDEWTSFRNKRYLNVNLHYNNGLYFNLGLIRIEGSCPAEVARELVEKKLSEFKLNASKDIVAATTDGASVMKKFGQLTLFQHQQCYNHAIHLAVVDTLYKKADTGAATSDARGSTDEENSKNGSDEDELDDLPEDSNMVTPGENEYKELRPEIKEALKRVRQIIKIFKMSPVKNSILQRYVRDQHGKEIGLILDCKTRWNSIEPMLERFLNLYDSILKALTDLNYSDLLIQIDETLPQLRKLSKTLKPIKLAVEALGRRDSTLLTSEGILKFLFSALKEEKWSLSQELFRAIKSRILQRRNEDLVSLMRYLQNKDKYDSLANASTTDSEGYGGELSISTKTKITKLIMELMNRLFIAYAEVDQEPESAAPDFEDHNVVNVNSLNKQLEEAINASLETKAGKDDFNKTIKKEMLIYEGTNKLTENLSKLLDALKSIQPTSTESERVFSISSNFCFKKKGRFE